MIFTIIFAIRQKIVSKHGELKQCIDIKHIGLKNRKMNQSEQHQYSNTVGKDGNAAFLFQNGANAVTDSQGFVNGSIDKSNHHIDNSVNQVMSFEICAVRFSFKHIKFLIYI